MELIAYNNVNTHRHAHPTYTSNKSKAKSTFKFEKKKKYGSSSSLVKPSGFRFATINVKGSTEDISSSSDVIIRGAKLQVKKKIKI